MKEIGVINSEGGPLLLADIQDARLWRGAEEGSFDYQKACQFFDSNPSLEGGEILMTNGQGLLWEMKGAGTASVFRADNNEIIVVRIWPKDPLDSVAARFVAEYPSDDAIELGTITVTSMVLSVLWAVESGACLNSVPSTMFQPSREPAIAGSVLAFPIQNGSFRCTHSDVETSRAIGRKLRVVPI